jgi:glutathione S-transferase
MDSLTLVSHPTCPYVQRAAIVLLEKGVPFERIDIDLENKPDWFLAKSPLGKVPLLLVGDEVLFESAVIAEYLDESTPNPLHPADALLRARHRALIEFGSTCLVDSYLLQVAKDEEAVRHTAANLRKKFAWVEQSLGSGPFLLGDRFSLADAAFAPVFRPLALFAPFVALDVFADAPKVRAWSEALLARPSVRAAVPADYTERLFAWLTTKESWVAAQRSA